jgi:hypothetical protein
MQRRKVLFHIFSVFLIFTSCEVKSEFDDDLLVGTIRVMDRNIPFPFLLEKTQKGMLLIDHQNTLIDSSTSTGIDYALGDTIKMQNHHFLVMKTKKDLWVYDAMDSVNFLYPHPLYAAQFVKAEKSKKIDLTSFRQKLKENIFRTEVTSAHFAAPNRDLKIFKILQFSEDSLSTTYNYFYQGNPVYSEKKVSAFHIFERKGKLFFSEGGEHPSSRNLYQVLNVDDNSFSLKTFRNNDEKFEQFQISQENGKPENAHLFNRCMEGQPGEYYHKNLTFSKGNEFLIRKIGENAPQASGDGFITVHFTINCKGEMGHLGLEQMNSEYQSTSFETALVQHIITEVMELKDWPEIKSGSLYKDIHSFLMFRIKNGKITDLCP